MNNENNMCKPHCSICWKAILAGVFVAIGLFILFNVLSLGIGLATLTSTKGGMEVLAFAAFAWMFLGTYVIFFLSANVTSKLTHLSSCNKCMDKGECCCNEAKDDKSCCAAHKCGMVSGFIVWSIVTVALFLATSFAGPQMVLVNNLTGQSPTSYMSDNSATANGMMQGSTPVQNVKSNMANSKAPANIQVISNEAKKDSHSLGLIDFAAFLLLLSGAMGGVCGGYYCSRYHRCKDAR